MMQFRHTTANDMKIYIDDSEMLKDATQKDLIAITFDE